MICFATASGDTSPADCEINLVSIGLLFSSLANPGVSVSGGKDNVTDMLYGFA
jgi:hypothetical protein